VKKISILLVLILIFTSCGGSDTAILTIEDTTTTTVAPSTTTTVQDTTTTTVQDTTQLQLQLHLLRLTSEHKLITMKVMRIVRTKKKLINATILQLNMTSLKMY